jgi:hypothetical protein
MAVAMPCSPSCRSAAGVGAAASRSSTPPPVHAGSEQAFQGGMHVQQSVTQPVGQAGAWAARSSS